MGKMVLITGGARSGKSRFAQQLAGTLSKTVLFVATAEALDDEMKLRIDEHRKNRPQHWQTLEVTEDVGRQIEKSIGKSRTVVIDCVTMWLNSFFNRYSRGDELNATLIEKKLNSEIKKLLSCIKKIQAIFIIVTNEVGLGIVPDNNAARLYRDLLGSANQSLALEADEVYLLVSGIPVTVK